MSEAEKVAEKIRAFLKNAEALTREMTPEGSEITFTPIFPKEAGVSEPHGVRIQTADGRFFQVIAQEHAFGIDTSDLFRFSTPWYAYEDPLRYVRAALRGFFAHGKKNS